MSVVQENITKTTSIKVFAFGNTAGNPQRVLSLCVWSSSWRPLRDDALNESTPDKQTLLDCKWITWAHSRSWMCVCWRWAWWRVWERLGFCGSWVVLPLAGSGTTNAGIWVLRRIWYYLLIFHVPLLEAAQCDSSRTGYWRTSCDQSPPSDVATSESHRVEAGDSSRRCDVEVRTRVMFVDQIWLGPPVRQQLPRKSRGVKSSPRVD